MARAISLKVVLGVAIALVAIITGLIAFLPTYFEGIDAASAAIARVRQTAVSLMVERTTAFFTYPIRTLMALEAMANNSQFTITTRLPNTTVVITDYTQLMFDTVLKDPDNSIRSFAIYIPSAEYFGYADTEGMPGLYDGQFAVHFEKGVYYICLATPEGGMGAVFPYAAGAYSDLLGYDGYGQVASLPAGKSWAPGLVTGVSSLNMVAGFHLPERLSHSPTASATDAVVQFDISTAKITTFLENLGLGENFRALIAHRGSRKVLGNSFNSTEPAVWIERTGPTTTVVHSTTVGSYNDPAIREFLAFIGGEDALFAVGADSNSYSSSSSSYNRGGFSASTGPSEDVTFYDVVPISDAHGLDLLLVLIIKERDFMAGIYRSRTIVVACVATAVVVMVALGVAFAFAIARPIERMANHMQLTAQLQLLGPEEEDEEGGGFGGPDASSALLEVDRMLRSYARMREQLYLMKRFLPPSVLADLGLISDEGDDGPYLKGGGGGMAGAGGGGGGGLRGIGGATVYDVMSGPSEAMRREIRDVLMGDFAAESTVGSPVFSVAGGQRGRHRDGGRTRGAFDDDDYFGDDYDDESAAASPQHRRRYSDVGTGTSFGTPASAARTGGGGGTAADRSRGGRIGTATTVGGGGGGGGRSRRVGGAAATHRSFAEGEEDNRTHSMAYSANDQTTITSADNTRRYRNGGAGRGILGLGGGRGGNSGGGSQHPRLRRLNLAPSLASRRIAVVCFNVSGWHDFVRRQSSSEGGVINYSYALNRYVDGVSRRVAEHRGIVDTFQGDRVTATFNAVAPLSSYARRGVACAIDVHRDFASGRGMALPIGGNAGAVVTVSGLRSPMMGAAAGSGSGPRGSVVASVRDTHTASSGGYGAAASSTRGGGGTAYGRDSELSSTATAPTAAGGGAPALQVTAGVAVGTAIVGNAGTIAMMRFTVTGQCYSDAAALERYGRSFRHGCPRPPPGRSDFYPTPDAAIVHTTPYTLTPVIVSGATVQETEEDFVYQFIDVVEMGRMSEARRRRGLIASAERAIGPQEQRRRRGGVGGASGIGLGGLALGSADEWMFAMQGDGGGALPPNANAAGGGGGGGVSNQQDGAFDNPFQPSNNAFRALLKGEATPCEILAQMELELAQRDGTAVAAGVGMGVGMGMGLGVPMEVPSGAEEAAIMPLHQQSDHNHLPAAAVAEIRRSIVASTDLAAAAAAFAGNSDGIADFPPLGPDAVFHYNFPSNGNWAGVGAVGAAFSNASASNTTPSAFAGASASAAVSAATGMPLMLGSGGAFFAGAHPTHPQGDAANGGQQHPQPLFQSGGRITAATTPTGADVGLTFGAVLPRSSSPADHQHSASVAAASSHHSTHHPMHGNVGGGAAPAIHVGMGHCLATASGSTAHTIGHLAIPQHSPQLGPASGRLFANPQQLLFSAGGGAAAAVLSPPPLSTARGAASASGSSAPVGVGVIGGGGGGGGAIIVSGSPISHHLIMGAPQHAMGMMGGPPTLALGGGGGGGSVGGNTPFVAGLSAPPQHQQQQQMLLLQQAPPSVCDSAGGGGVTSAANNLHLLTRQQQQQMLWTQQFSGGGGGALGLSQTNTATNSDAPPGATLVSPTSTQHGSGAGAPVVGGIGLGLPTPSSRGPNGSSGDNSSGLRHSGSVAGGAASAVSGGGALRVNSDGTSARVFASAPPPLPPRPKNGSGNAVSNTCARSPAGGVAFGAAHPQPLRQAAEEDGYPEEEGLRHSARRQQLPQTNAQGANDDDGHNTLHRVANEAGDDGDSVFVMGAPEEEEEEGEEMKAMSGSPPPLATHTLRGTLGAAEASGGGGYGSDASVAGGLPDGGLSASNINVAMARSAGLTVGHPAAAASASAEALLPPHGAGEDGLKGGGATNNPFGFFSPLQATGAVGSAGGLAVPQGADFANLMSLSPAALLGQGPFGFAGGAVPPIGFGAPGGVAAAWQCIPHSTGVDMAGKAQVWSILAQMTCAEDLLLYARSMKSM